VFCLVSSFAIGCETVDDGFCDISLSIIQVSPDVLQGLHYIAQGRYIYCLRRRHVFLVTMTSI